MPSPEYVLPDTGLRFGAVMSQNFGKTLELFIVAMEEPICYHPLTPASGGHFSAHPLTRERLERLVIGPEVISYILQGGALFPRNSFGGIAWP